MMPTSVKLAVYEKCADIHVRPAQLGDICVLLEPLQEAEIRHVGRLQRDLQRLFGGSPIEYVHLTCQRFACPDEQILQRFIDNLTGALADMEPISFEAVALETLYAASLQTNILKWKIETTAKLRSFVKLVEYTLQDMGIAALYTTGFVSSLISALKDVPDLPPSSLLQHTALPYSLFTTDKIVVSRIDGPDRFRVLAKIRLAEYTKLNY